MTGQVTLAFSGTELHACNYKGVTMRYAGTLHDKLPPDSRIVTRQPLQAETPYAEQQSTEAVALGLVRLKESVEELGRLVENRGMIVDEYNYSGGTTALLTVQPNYELTPEKIESIIITGPAGAITLTLGDRVWNLTIPATGAIVLAPIAILLSRTDTRQLSAASAGAYTLELMGIADKRYQT